MATSPDMASAVKAMLLFQKARFLADSGMHGSALDVCARIMRDHPLEQAGEIPGSLRIFDRLDDGAAVALELGAEDLLVALGVGLLLGDDHRGLNPPDLIPTRGGHALACTTGTRTVRGRGWGA